MPCRSGRSPNLRLPFAGELEGALADWLGEGLVRCDGGEPFARRLALGSQTVDQTQGLTRRTKFRGSVLLELFQHRLKLRQFVERFEVGVIGHVPGVFEAGGDGVFQTFNCARF